MTTAIQTEADVQPGQDLKLSVAVPAGVTPGKHKVTVIIEDEQTTTKAKVPWPVFNNALYDPSFTMRREDLYGDNDNGR